MFVKVIVTEFITIYNIIITTTQYTIIIIFTKSSDAIL